MNLSTSLYRSQEKLVNGRQLELNSKLFDIRRVASRVRASQAGAITHSHPVLSGGLVTKPLLRRSESLGYVVNHLARLFAKALHHEIARYEVVPGQFAQLLALYEEEGITQQELAARVGIEQPTMAATLQRMERDGLIERRPDPADGRRAMIYLTSRSRRLQGKLVEAARRINAIAIGDLGAPKTHEFFDTARSMATRLEDHLDAESALPVPRAR